jgi:hypothetical protein
VAVRANAIEGNEEECGEAVMNDYLAQITSAVKTSGQESN